MKLTRKKKCKHCKKLFIPDHRNRDRQKYCGKLQCRKAGKAASQKKWLSKPENKNYFKGPVHVNRVRQWRQQNPGYWKRTCLRTASALQESLTPQPTENTDDNGQKADDALQDLLNRQPPVMIGLISNFIGSALQDDIAHTLFRMQQSGQDILYYQTEKRRHL